MISKVFYIFSAAILMVCSLSHAAAPTTQELIDLAPIIDAGHRHESYEIHGWFGPEPASSFEFHLWHRAPDHDALHIWHRVDGTPLLFTANGNVLAYDAIQSRMISLQSHHIEFLLAGQDSQLKATWSISSKPGPAKYDITVDIHSLLALAENLSTESRQDGSFLIIGISKKGNLEAALIDRAEKSPYRHLEMDMHDLNKPVLVLDKMAVDEPVADEVFALPDVEQLKKKITVVTRDDMKSDADLELAIEQDMVYGGRMAIYEPSYRPKVESLIGTGDWDAVRENDRKTSAIVRELLGAGTAATSEPSQ